MTMAMRMRMRMRRLAAFIVLMLCTTEWPSGGAAHRSFQPQPQPQCTRLNNNSTPTNNTSGTNYLSSHRAKRYLAFEKGSSFVFQCSMAKAIVSGTPRGLNEITEFSLYYPLPSAGDAMKRVRPRPGAGAGAGAAPPDLNFKLTQPSYGNRWQRQQVSAASGRFCGGGNFFGNNSKGHNVRRHGPARCASGRRGTPPRRHRTKRQSGRNSKASRRPKRDSQLQKVLLNFVGEWSEIFGLDADLCLRRAVCEAQHLLLPPGHSLFHDIVRLMIGESLDARWPNHAAAAAAAAGATTAQWRGDCAEEAAQCGLSFLAHFTDLVHGPPPFM